LAGLFCWFKREWIGNRDPGSSWVVTIKAKKEKTVTHPFGWDGWERDKLFGRSV